MSTLVLVRHGQARFGTGDYDALSPLGVAQCQSLGRHWQGQSFNEVWSGTMLRQSRSAALATGAVASTDEAWNEYDADGILGHLAPELASRDPGFAALQSAFHNDRSMKAFQRMFEPLMRAWLAAEIAHPGVEPWLDFRHRIEGALRRITGAPGVSRRVAVFTSGGPIGTAVMLALGAPDARAVELNWRVRNASVTEFLFSQGRPLTLDTFNATAHLAPGELTFR